MIESQRRAYLQAMGFDVWIARSHGDGQARLQLAPGSGGILLVGASSDECATPLAGDLARALGPEAGWAWPVSGDGTGGVTLPEVVADRLTTRIILFGEATCRSLFGDEAPAFVGSAAVTPVPALRELAGSAAARRALWCTLQDPLAPGGAANVA